MPSGPTAHWATSRPRSSSSSLLSGQLPRSSQPEWSKVGEQVGWTIANIHVEIRVPSPEPDGIFAEEALQSGVVVPRPVVVEAGAVVLPARVLEEVRTRCTRRGCLAERLVGVLRLHGPAAYYETPT